jgi:DNA-binding beta-propeller fold protein YncE
MKRLSLLVLLTAVVLTSTGCPQDAIAFLTGAILRLDVTTDGLGGYVVEETPEGSRQINPGQPIREVVSDPFDGRNDPSSTGTIQALPQTAFVLTDTGGLLQLNVEPQAAQVVVRSLATGHRLRAGVASPDDQFLYLASSGPQNASGLAPMVLIVNRSTFQTAGSVALPSNFIVNAMTITPGGKFIYAAGNLAAQVFTDPSAVVCHVIDTASRTLVHTFTFPGSRPRPEIVASPDGARIYVTEPDGVAVIDVLTQTHSHTIEVLDLKTSGTSAHIAINPSGTTLYVAPLFTGIGVYDLATSTHVGDIDLDELSTMAMAVTADGRRLVVDHIVRDPATGLNDFPRLEFFNLPSGALAVSKPWTGPRDPPITVHSLTPLPPSLP